MPAAALRLEVAGDAQQDGEGPARQEACDLEQVRAVDWEHLIAGLGVKLQIYRPNTPNFVFGNVQTLRISVFRFVIGLAVKFQI